MHSTKPFESIKRHLPEPRLSPLRKHPVFIVGVSRSGTTLMRRILNSSDYFAISRENHFLGHLVESEGVRHKLRQFGDLREDANVERVVEFLYEGGLQRSSRHRMASAQWVWITSKVKREDFLQRILASDRSERALFSIMMEVYADHRNRPGIGEKTPAHVRYIPTILEWFPEGKVIHMLRDPRAIYVSEVRRRWLSPVTSPYRQLRHSEVAFRTYVLLETAIAWFDSVRKGLRYSRQYPANYLVLRFEDLVREPEKHVRKVCRFVGVDFQPAMMLQVGVSQGFSSGHTGFDANAADRWRLYIGSWSEAWFRYCFRMQLQRLGYPL